MWCASNFLAVSAAPFHPARGRGVLGTPFHRYPHKGANGLDRPHIWKQKTWWKDIALVEQRRSCPRAENDNAIYHQLHSSEHSWMPGMRHLPAEWIWITLNSPEEKVTKYWIYYQPSNVAKPIVLTFWNILSLLTYSRSLEISLNISLDSLSNGEAKYYDKPHDWRSLPEVVASWGDTKSDHPLMPSLSYCCHVDNLVR